MPPIVYVNRNWVLHESDPIGKVVERVRAEGEQDELIFGLEPSTLNYHNTAAKPQPPLPFTIDNATGIIHLNDTLKGRVRE